MRHLKFEWDMVPPPVPSIHPSIRHNIFSSTQQLEIQLSVIHNYASQYLGLVIGSAKPAAKSWAIGAWLFHNNSPACGETCSDHWTTESVENSV